MFFFLPWNLLRMSFKKTTRHQEKLTKTTTASTQITTSIYYSPIINTTQIKQTTENITTYMKTITFYTYSFVINTTPKNNIPIRNKMFISLFISLILISLCIGISYCIMIYFNHYLNMKSTVKQDISAFNRESFTSSKDSTSDTQLDTCKTKSNTLCKAIDNKNKERRSSIDSIKLLRY
ncbi:unnamed protein product [Rotaria sp. Silwood2]|nr:unnamed protein product [Rotaria sp. Silwood2]CAF3335130.1 unnamed protein product [Rotaria sp. Silwood2]CAF4430583.1 unnamed protein product [Rotaria sp. Silwood2]CAF4757884.1 unnamed protein product [Rotaria sp. Silwood2]